MTPLGGNVKGSHDCRHSFSRQWFGEKTFHDGVRRMNDGELLTALWKLSEWESIALALYPLVQWFH